MKSEGKLSDKSSQQFTLREKEMIPSGEPFTKPKLDLSLERKSKEVRRERPPEQGLGLAGSRANSPGRLPVIVAPHLKEPVRMVDSRTPQPFTLKTPIREQSSSPVLQTQFVPMFSYHRAGSPPRLHPLSENDLSRRNIQQIIINPPPMMHTQVVQLPQAVHTTHNITLPQVTTTHSVQVPAGSSGQMPQQQFIQPGMQQSMVVNNSRNVADQMLSQKDEVLRKFKQSIDDKDDQLRSYSMRINSLEEKLEEQDLEKKANIILTEFVAEISGYFSREELTLDQLRQHILQLISSRQDGMSTSLPEHQRKNELAEELYRLLVKYKELEGKLTKAELSLFEFTRDNNTKTREIEQLRTKVLQLQSQSSQSSSSLQANSRMEFDMEMRNLKSINFSLEKEVEYLKYKIGLAHLPHISAISRDMNSSVKNGDLGSGSQALTNAHSSLENEHLRAKILALEIQLESRNQEIMILSHRIRSVEDERQGIPSKSNDSLSYSLEGYDRYQRLSYLNHSNIRKVREEYNGTSALRLINSLNQMRTHEQQYENILGTEEARLQQQAQLQDRTRFIMPDISRSADQPKRPSSFGMQQTMQLDVVPYGSSKEFIPSPEGSPYSSELGKQPTHAIASLSAANQQLRERIVELENETAYTKERLRAQLTIGDKEYMVRRNEYLKDEKLKLELKIIGLEKYNTEIEAKVREMWDMHKRQVETERYRNRIQIENFKQKEMILKARIQELEDVVKIDSGSKEDLGMNSDSNSNRYEQMEEELRNMQEYRAQAADLQSKLNALMDENEQLQRDQVARDSELAIFRQQLEGMSQAKRLLEEQLGLPGQSKSRSSSINPSPLKEIAEAITIIQNKAYGSNTVEIGVYADFPSYNDLLLEDYREQLETLNERMNLLTVNNSRLKSSEQTLKIDSEALRRHLDQTGAQMDMLIKELDQARQKNEKVLQLELELEEFRNKVQTYKLHERSFRMEEAFDPMLKLYNSAEKAKNKELEQSIMRNLEQDINVLSEQLRFSQKEITTRKELEEQLRDQYEKEIRRLENDLKIYKESAQGSMSLCDENDTLKRQVAELRSGRKYTDLTQFTQYQDQQREVIGYLTARVYEEQMIAKRLYQQISLLTYQLKSSEQEKSILKYAENVFKNAQSNMASQNSSVAKTYEYQIRSVNRELESMRQEIVQLRQAESQYQQNSHQLEQMGRQNVEKLSRAIQDQQIKYQQKEQELVAMKTSYEAAYRNRQELAAHIERLGNESSKAKSTEYTLRKKIEYLNKMYSDMNSEKIKDAEKYIRDINQYRTNRIEAVKQVQEGLYQQEAEKMMKLQQEMTNQLTYLRKYSHTLRSYLVTTQSAREELRAKLAQTEEQTKKIVEGMKGSLAEYEAINGKLRVNIEQLTARNNELQQENVQSLNALQYTYERMTKATRTLEGQISQSKLELVRKEYEIRRVEQSARQSTQQIEERMTMMVRSMETELSQTRTHLNQKYGEVRRIYESMRVLKQNEERLTISIRSMEYQLHQRTAKSTYYHQRNLEAINLSKQTYAKLASAVQSLEFELTQAKHQSLRVEEELKRYIHKISREAEVDKSKEVARITYILNSQREREKSEVLRTATENFKQEFDRTMGQLKMQLEDTTRKQSESVLIISKQQEEFNRERTELERHYRYQEHKYVLKISELELHCEELLSNNGHLSEENAIRNQKFIEGKNAIERLEGMFREIEQAHLLKIGDLESYIEELRKAEGASDVRIQQLEYELNDRHRQLGMLETTEHEHLHRISEMEIALEQLQRSSRQEEQHFHESYNALEQECNGLRRDNNFLGYKLRVLESTKEREAHIMGANEELQKLLNNLKFENSELRMKESGHLEHISQLTRTEQYLHNTNNQLKAQIRDITSNTEYLNGIIRDLNREIDQHKGMLKNLYIQTTNQLSQHQYLHYLNEKIQGLAQLNHSLEHENRSVRESNYHLTMQLAYLTQQCDYLSADKDKLERIVSQLTSELQASVRSISTSTVRINEVTGMHGGYQHQLDTVRSSTSINEGGASYSNLRKQVSELSQQCQRLYSDKANLEQQVHSLTRNIYQLNKSTLKIFADTAQTTSSSRLQSNLQHHVYDLELRNCELTNELYIAQFRLKSEEYENSKLQKRIREASQELERVNSQKWHNQHSSSGQLASFVNTSETKDSPSAVQHTLTELTNLCEQLANDKTRLEQQNLELNNRIQQEVAKMRSSASIGFGTSSQQLISTSTHQLTSQVESMTVEHQRLQQQVTELTVRLREHTTRLLEAASTQTQSQESTRRLSLQLEELQTRNNQLSSEHQELQKKLHEVTNEFHLTNQMYNASQQANASLNHRVSELSELCQKFETKLESMLSQLVVVVDRGSGRQLHSSRSFGVGPIYNSLGQQPLTKSVAISSRSLADASEAFNELVQQCEQLINEKGRLEHTVVELNQEKQARVSAESVKLLTIQITELNNQCEYLSNERNRLERRTKELTSYLADIETARQNESDWRKQLQAKLDQVTAERDEAIRNKTALYVRMNQPNNLGSSQSLRTTVNESIGQAISTTTLIKNIVTQNASQMNDRLQRQLTDLSEQCDHLVCSKYQLEQRVNELTSLVQYQQQQLLSKVSNSVPNNEVRLNAQINELTRRCESLLRDKNELERKVNELNSYLRSSMMQSRSSAHTNIELYTDTKLLKYEVSRLHYLVRKRTSEIDEVMEQLEGLANEVKSSRRQLAQAESVLKVRDRELADLSNKYDALNREYLSTKQLMDGLRARNVDAVIGDPLQRYYRSISIEAERMLLTTDELRSNRQPIVNFAETREHYYSELLRVTQQNNQLSSQIGVLTSEKESLRRDLELRYQECNSLRLNLQHQQMINSELADELKEYIKPAAAIQQQLPQHHRYSLPESIKESKSDHSGVSDVAVQPHQQSQEELQRLRSELQLEHNANSKLRLEVEILRNEQQQLRDTNTQLAEHIARLKQQLQNMNAELQKRTSESTDYSVQESMRLLKNDLTDRERYLYTVRKYYSQFRATNDYYRNSLHEQIKAMKQVSFDLERYNSELTERNSQLESRLRITQTDSVNIRLAPTTPQADDKTSRSEHFKNELDSIIQEMHSKRPYSNHAAHRRSSRSNEPIPVLRDDAPEPKKPRILRSKSPELNDEYFNNSGKFQNPFDDFKEIEKPVVQPPVIINTRAQPNQNTFSFMRYVEPRRQSAEPYQVLSSKQTLPNQPQLQKNSSSSSIKSQLTQPIYSPSNVQSSINTAALMQGYRRSSLLRIDDSLNTQRTEQLPPASINQFNSRPSLPKAEYESNSSKRVSSSSQGNVNFIRVTELSRSRHELSSGPQQVTAVSSPRSSQGPAQFVKKSVILNRNEYLNTLNEPVNAASKLSISGQTIKSSRGLPTIEAPYFGVPPPADIVRTPSSGQSSSRVKTIKMESLRSSRTPAASAMSLQQTPNHQQSPSQLQTPSQKPQSPSYNNQSSHTGQPSELGNSQQKETVQVSRQTLVQQSVQQTNMLATKLQEFRPVVPAASQPEPTHDISEVDYSISSSSRRSSSQSSLPGMAIFQQHFSTSPADCCAMSRP